MRLASRAIRAVPTWMPTCEYTELSEIVVAAVRLIGPE